VEGIPITRVGAGKKSFSVRGKGGRKGKTVYPGKGGAAI